MALSRILRTWASKSEISSSSYVLAKSLRNNSLRTPTSLLVLDLVGLELHPYPVDGLISHHSPQEDLSNWTAEAPVEAHLFRSAIGTLYDNDAQLYMR